MWSQAHPAARALLDIEWKHHPLPTANLYRVLNRVLRSLTKLTDLCLNLPDELEHYTDRGCGAGQLQRWLFSGCTFSLTKLTISLPYDASLVAFLATQPRITELCLGCVRQPVKDGDATRALLPHGALPALRELEAMPLRAAHLRDLISGRPIEEVHLTLFHSDGVAALDALVLAARPVRCLTVMSLRRSRINDVIVQAIGQRLPALEELRVAIFCREYTTDMLLASTPIFRSFSRLRYITVLPSDSSLARTFSSPNEANRDTAEAVLAAERRVAEQWTAACPTLRIVNLPLGNTFTCYEEGCVSLRGHLTPHAERTRVYSS